MSGGWAGSDRRRRLPPEWHRLRRQVLRADPRCRAVLVDGSRCGSPATEVDHVVAGDDHSRGNLQGLCRWHHARKSAREGAAARGRRPSVVRPVGPHPSERVGL